MKKLLLLIVLSATAISSYGMIGITSISKTTEAFENWLLLPKNFEQQLTTPEGREQIKKIADRNDYISRKLGYLGATLFLAAAVDLMASDLRKTKMSRKHALLNKVAMTTSVLVGLTSAFFMFRNNKILLAINEKGRAIQL